MIYLNSEATVFRHVRNCTNILHEYNSFAGMSNGFCGRGEDKYVAWNSISRKMKFL